MKRPEATVSHIEISYCSSRVHSEARQHLFRSAGCGIYPVKSYPVTSTGFMGEARKIMKPQAGQLYCITLAFVPQIHNSIKYQLGVTIACPPVLPFLFLFSHLPPAAQMMAWVAMPNQRWCVLASPSLCSWSILSPVWKRPWKRWEESFIMRWFKTVLLFLSWPLKPEEIYRLTALILHTKCRRSWQKEIKDIVDEKVRACLSREQQWWWPVDQPFTMKYNETVAPTRESENTELLGHISNEDKIVWAEVTH